MGVVEAKKDTEAQNITVVEGQSFRYAPAAGYPVYTSQFVPAIAAGQPVIAFGDMSYYNIGDRGARSFAALHELYAGVGQVAFVAKERVDGKLVLPEAVQVLKMKETAAQG